MPKRGRIIPLGSEVGKRGALTGGRNPTWHVSIKVEHPHDRGRGRAEDTLTMHTHAHSHIDGLAHICYDGGARQWQVGELVEVDDLQRALDAIGCAIEPGDAVVLHSGWFALHTSGDPRFHEGEPGLSPAAADWLAAQDPVLVGMDNSAIEPLPPAPGTNPLYVHETLLRDHGIYILELLDLAELARSGAGEFLFTAAPLRINRGLGSPTNPLAII